ncbi:hypothetical protein [Actinomycetospora sp. CA-053990]|uniref:hypothetical protein n=1 Tax=Actinomycetospora sp. CA-053990 TaxID=3239891 RepID=UPI003D94E66D
MTALRRRLPAGLLVLLLALLVTAGTAAAHESTPVGVQRIELSLGARTLALTITAPPEGGGRMPVVVLPRGDAPRVTSRSRPSARAGTRRRRRSSCPRRPSGSRARSP